MRSALAPILIPLAGAAVVGCNLALGLGGYDFNASSASGGGTTSSTQSTSDSTSQSTSSSSQGGGGATTTTGSTGGGGAGGAGGQGGSPPSGEVVWSLGVGTGDVSVGGVAADSTGRVFVSGSYSAGGASPLPGCDLLSATNATWKGFLLEVDGAGQCIHALVAGAKITAVAVAPDDKIALSITYTGHLGLPGGVDLGPATGVDSAVLLYAAGADPSGDAPLWARGIGQQGDQVVTDLAFDPEGNVWASGHYTSTLLAGTNNAFNKAGLNTSTGFLMRFAPSGGEPSLTAYRLFTTTTAANVETFSVAARAGLVAAGGRAYGGLDFGNGPTTAKGGYDGYYACFSAPDMTYLRGASLAQGGEQVVRDVAFAPSGDLYHAGAAYGDLDFGSGIHPFFVVQRSFLARVAAGGETLKVIDIANAEANAPVFAAVLPGSQDVVFAGMMSGTVALPGAQNLSASADGNDAVVGRIDASLSQGKWLRVVGGSFEQGADALALGPHGSVLIAGHADERNPLAPEQTFAGIGLFVARLNP